MVINVAMVLWLIMLAMVLTSLVPKPTGWPRFALWVGLVLLTALLVHFGVSP